MAVHNGGSYQGNPLLKPANFPVSYTQEQLDEYIKCSKDPLYFAKNYIKIVNLDEGLVNFKPYAFQENIIKTIHENRFTICKIPRQSGKTTSVSAYLIWCILFIPNYKIAILANKADTAKDILGRIQTSYENLPKWLQQGVVEWNKYSITVENGSKIIAAATSASAVRGSAQNCLVLDEFAHVPNNVAEEFLTSVYPTITSGKNTKLVMISTPKGLNLFYKTWINALNKKNSYIPVECFWYDIPGRDEKFKAETIANTSETQWDSEYNCVDENTIIEVYDTVSKEYKKITIGELYRNI